jgi:hypothetical protein
MTRTPVHTRDFLASRLNFLINIPEVLRLVNDITTCSIEWLDHPDLEALEHSGGRELFPCFTTYLRRHLMEVRGVIYPNLMENEHVIYHVIRLDLADFQFYFRLRTTQTAFLLSPFHCRFLSMLFGRLVIQHLSLASREQQGVYPFTAYSLEEHVVADYLQSLTLAPCATIKLDPQDNPYIRLHALHRRGFAALRPAGQGPGGGHHPGLAPVQTPPLLFGGRTAPVHRVCHLEPVPAPFVLPAALAFAALVS